MNRNTLSLQLDKSLMTLVTLDTNDTHKLQKQ